MCLYRVYVVQNAGGKFYIGVSEDVRRRIGQHNDRGSRWIKGRGPWACVWKSKKSPLGDARKLGNLLKQQKGGSGFFRLTSLAPRGGA
jgi:predicted GIY-YIG superfamily endonuclease